MIALLITLGWLLAGLVTFRYSGHAWERHMKRGHTYQRICGACTGYRDSLSGYREPHGYHTSTFMAILPATLVAWPGMLTFYVLSALSRWAGMDGNFFAPAPQVKSLEERRAEKMQRLEDEKKALTSRITELEAMNRTEVERLRRLGINA